MPGYEADDIIATLASQAAPDMDVLIVTGDRDPIQLVTDDVTLLYTMRGISEMARFTPESVEAKYGLTPAQYPDFAALRGDPSDNLPGIPGVGEKTATRWIAEFGSLANLVDRVDEVKGKAGDALREHLAGVLRNSQLTQLVRDVPLEVGPHDLRPRAVGPRADPPAIRHAPVPGAAGPPVYDAAERDRRPGGRRRYASGRCRRVRRGCCDPRAG